MFRNPRENRRLPPSSRLEPSIGRPPSPPRSKPVAYMSAKAASRKATPKPNSTPMQLKKTQTTLVSPAWGKKSPANNGSKSKSKAAGTPNGNIMTFFKKAEEQNNRIFLQERGAYAQSLLECGDEEDVGWSDEMGNGVVAEEDTEERFNEKAGSIKKRKLTEEAVIPACTPPLPEMDEHNVKAPSNDGTEPNARTRKKTGPFLDDSESEAEKEMQFPRRGTIIHLQATDWATCSKSSEDSTPIDSPGLPTSHVPPLLKSEMISQFGGDDFDEFEGLEDDELLEGEEYDERRFMEEQRRLEMAEAGFDDDPDDFDAPPMFPNGSPIDSEVEGGRGEEAPTCPLCSADLEGLTEQEISVHVNACLDGNPLPPQPTALKKENIQMTTNNAKMFKRPLREARPAQTNPFQLGETSVKPKSAFSAIMASHAEDNAWATAASSEKAARGKPSYQRTCPFYKILPGFFICVDAFRYGKVKGQNAYFLSHFHSDHYVGLTKSWSHGPIFCSRITANLVRQQLQVDSKWVVDLEWEKKTEVPGTEGVYVTMISANHCPGSSLFLFEKELGKGKNSKLQRVLHCGDFRACQAHIEHPLLRPEVVDAISGKSRLQKLDVCYLDTTYLNPRYAFPPQEQVIQACADMCVSLSKMQIDESDAWEQTKKARAGQAMANFVRMNSDVKKEEEEENDESGLSKDRGRLLVVVGTYSIGKERICVGIAKALKSKIYASKSKQRICHALEDPELNSLLTSDPRSAQVHMTPLFEIRAETLDEYLRDYMDTFSRAVAFRPSGWNYRPPKSRFTDSPTVQTVLHSKNWKSEFSMKDLHTQPGSNSRVKCYGVPYSEHSSFRELTMFCCALKIDKIIPTVNVGSAKTRERMKGWCEKWMSEKKKNGLFRLKEDGSGW